MTLLQFRELFFQCEETQGLFQLRSCGIVLWDLVRYDVWSYLQSRALGQAQDFRSTTRVSRSVKVVRAIIAIASDVVVLIRAIFVRHPFLLFRTSRYRKGTTPIDYASWDVQQTLGINALYIESYLPRSEDLSARSYHNTFRRLWPKSQIPIAHIQQIVERLHPVINQLCTVAELTGVIESSATKALGDLDYYRVLFRGLRPKAIFLVQDGNQKGLILAARQARTAVYELQHGLINSFHPMYSYPPSVATETIDSVPCGFLTFSEYWSKQLSLPSCRTTAIGNTMFYRKPRAAVQGGPILVINANIYSEELATLVEGLTDRINGKPVLVKLHPNQFHEEADIRLRLGQLAGVEVVGIEKSIDECLSVASSLVAVQSTVVLEALQIGIPVFLYRIANYDVHSDLIDAKLVKVFGDLDELEDLLRRSPDAAPPTTEFFRPFERQRFIDLLEQMSSEAAGGVL